MYNPRPPGEILREYLDEMPVADVAARLGVDSQSLLDILSGQEPLTMDMVERIAGMAGANFESRVAIRQELVARVEEDEWLNFEGPDPDDCA